MKLVEILKPSAIVGDLRGPTAQDVLTELSGPVALATGVEAGQLRQALLDREALGSTGVGDGVAIPHCKLAGLPALTASFGRSKPGIDFKAIDSKPAQLFIALFAPDNAPGVHLQALARISRLFRNAAFRDALLKASDAAEIYRLIEAEDAKP
jgi:PTS system nitrogen regulatory IIA component